jgi:PAS domain S-box-containing protein
MPFGFAIGAIAILIVSALLRVIAHGNEAVAQVTGWNVLKFNFSLCALSLALAVLGAFAASRRMRLAFLFGGVGLAGMISLLTLVEHMTGVSFGIDNAFVVDLSGDTGFVNPGRMSVTASLSLFMLAVGLGMMPFRKWAGFGQLPAALAFALCWFNLVANLYGVHNLFGPGLYISMSVAASICGILLSCAVLWLRPRLGIMRLVSGKGPSGVVARRLLPAVLLVPTTLGGLRLIGETLGLYDGRFGLALYAVLNIGVFALLVLSAARTMDQLDRKRKQAQSNLDRSEHRFRRVIESLPQLVWTCLPNGQCDFLNQQWVDYTGEPEETQLGSGWLRFVHPDDILTISNEWQKAVKAEKPLDAEYRVRSASGEYRWFKARATALRDANGVIVKWFGSSLDIHELKTAEEEILSLNTTLERRVAERTEELHDANQSMQSVLDAAAQVAIVATDSEGVIEIFNHGAEMMLGYSAKELVGRRKADIFHDVFEIEARQKEISKKLGRVAAISETFLEYAQPGDPESNRWTYIRKDGSRLRVHLSLGTKKNLKGEIDGFVRIAVDVSDIEKLEQSLKAANRAKSEFLANMSHEIRTPMNGIIGMTGLLLDDQLTAEQRMFVETLRGSGEALLGLINDILDFSKIEAGKLELERIEFGLRPMVETTVQLLVQKAEEKGLELTCLVDHSLPDAAFGDPGRLRQVLLNLAGNAVKFTQKGDVSIHVTGVDGHPGRVKFEIRDTGIGVPPERQDRLFKAFSQADASTNRKYGGTGLGLAISKDLVAMMGGEIGMTSEAGVGSTFWFTAELAPKSGVPERVEPLPKPLIGARVLIVDDSEVNRLLLANLLLRWGCLYEQASDAQEVVRMLRAAVDAGTPFDMALIDYRMPGVEGIALGRMIREERALDGTRLVLMTSVTQRGHAKESEEAGFAGYVTKPIRQEDLKQVLEMVLRGEVRKPLVTQHTMLEARPRRGRILLAEDNRTNQLVAVEMLKRLGYWTEAVANGSEAVDALVTAPYDLVLMDCQMPEVDGYEATRMIRAGLRGVPNPDIAIVAMTAFAMTEDRDRCMEAGMDDYLSKPIDHKQLAAVVERWIGQKSTVRQRLQ